MLSHTITFRVRYAECDPMGVAHHSAYPVWFEIGRTELLRASHQRSLSYRELEERGVLLAVVSLSVKYRRPARYDDLLTLHTHISKIGHAKIEHEYALKRDGILLATAQTALACLDRDGRPRALPEELHAELSGKAAG